MGNLMLLPSSITWPCFLIVAAASFTDCKWRRIPNWLVVSGLAIALPVQWYGQGFGPGTLQWLGGIAVGSGMFAPGYLMRQMGAGDVKLMGALGAWLGPHAAAEAGAAAYVAGGLLALAAIVYRSAGSRRKARPADSGGTRSSEPSATTRIVASDDSPAVRGKAATIPFAVAIAAGTIGVLLLRY